MMRSIWSGAISFGLINIPVKLYSATEEHAISFDLLHKTDLSPIRYARICKLDGNEVPYQDIVKGYEYEKGEYVVVDEEEFKKLNVRKTGTIEILHFVHREEIDDIFFEKPYYLEPAKGAGKSYALLRETLYAANKVALVKFVFRNKEHLGIVRPYQNALLINQMRFMDEIRSLEDLKLPEEDAVSKKEVDMALKLVDQLTETFRPEAHHDEYVAELKQLLEAKVQGRPLRPKGEAAPKPSKVTDIMSLLEASLKENKPSKKPRRSPKRAYGT